MRDRLKFRFGLSKINVSGEKVSKLIDRTMYIIDSYGRQVFVRASSVTYLHVLDNPE